MGRSWRVTGRQDREPVAPAEYRQWVSSRYGQQGVEFGIGRPRGSPRRNEFVVAITRDEVDVVVENALPRSPAVGLHDVEARRRQPFTQQERNRVNGAHRFGRLVRGQRPQIGRVVARNDERMSRRRLAAVEEGHGGVVLVDAP